MFSTLEANLETAVYTAIDSVTPSSELFVLFMLSSSEDEESFFSKRKRRPQIFIKIESLL